MQHRILPGLIIFTIMVVLFPGGVSAESVLDQYFRGSEISFNLSEDNITDTDKFEFGLNMRFRHEGLSAFVRLSNARPFTFQSEGFDVQKRGFRYELNDDWAISGGHYSLIFGRGTVLTAIEDGPVDLDSQLDGGLIEGSIGFVDLTAFWGTHKSDRWEYFLTGVNTSPGDPADELYGGRAEFDLGEFDIGDFDIGVSYVDADMVRWGMQQTTVITELDFAADFGNIDLYYETAWFDRTQPEFADESLNGTSHLIDIIYSDSGYSVNGSWIRYDKAEFMYSTAPTLKRFEVDESQASPEDQTGYRFDVRLSPDPWDGHSVRLLYTDLKARETEDREFTNWFVEWTSPSLGDWSGTMSYDHIEGFLQYYGAINGTDENIRATVDGPFFSDTSFHCSGRYRLLRSEFENDEELELGFDWNVTSELTIGVTHETSSRLIEPPPSGFFDISPDSPGQWNLAFVRWAPDPWSEFELRVGSQRGGFKCSGGTCAQLPPFKGVQLTYFRSL